MQFLFTALFLFAFTLPFMDASLSYEEVFEFKGKFTEEIVMNLGINYDVHDPKHPCKALKFAEFFDNIYGLEIHLRPECFANIPSVMSAFMEINLELDEFREDILSYVTRSSFSYFEDSFHARLLQNVLSGFRQCDIENIGKNVPIGISHPCSLILPYLPRGNVPLRCRLSGPFTKQLVNSFGESIVEVPVEFINQKGALFFFYLTAAQVTRIVQQENEFCSQLQLSELQMLYLRSENFTETPCFAQISDVMKAALLGRWDEEFVEAVNIVFGGQKARPLSQSYVEDLAKIKSVTVNIDTFAPVSNWGLETPHGCHIIGDMNNAKTFEHLTPEKYDKVLIEHVETYLLPQMIPHYYNLLRPGGLFEWQSYRYVLRDNWHRAEYKKVPLYLLLSVKAFRPEFDVETGKIKVPLDYLEIAVKLLQMKDEGEENNHENFLRILEKSSRNITSVMEKMNEIKFRNIRLSLNEGHYDKQEEIVLKAEK